MRKHQQRKILELLQTVRQAQSAGLYADCQDGALAVGGFIEGIEGEGSHTVELLEEYCEILFKASNGEVGKKLLDKHFTKMENSVKTELRPDRIEIAFLSYNASMSDSIESIYLAAKADPTCDAVWLPIPYYERNPDGTLGSLHYEGAEYYPNIDCADWQEYDIEAYHPDIIVTFNPYDEGNYITSVHPNFYCKRLRELTDLLVYVPYYVSIIDEIAEHFCLVAGALYAHKVILQSAKIRDSYIRTFKAQYGNNFGKPEDKFVALGSSKFDIAINAIRSDSNLPEAWLNLIKDFDGNRKKVVLYNARLTDMSAGIENQLKKLKDVLACFKSKADVILWWRPHPLNLKTMKSMCPQFAEEYSKIVDDYRREGWGIYDDTSDLKRSLAESDAYYGDYSSIIALYGVLGKPIAILNNGLLIENVVAKAAEVGNQFDDGTYYWFTLYQENALFKMSKQTWETEYIATMPRITDGRVPVCAEIAECQEKIFVASSCEDSITVYDKKSAQLIQIALNRMNNPQNFKFYATHSYNEYVYLFGFSYPAIIKLNAITLEVEYITDWVKPLCKQTTNADNLFLGAGFVIDKEVILPAQSANSILVFNMESCASRIIAVPSKNSGYVKICFDGENYWLSARHSGGTVVKWHPERGVTEIEIPNGWVDGDYWNICCANGYAWYFPTLGNTAFKVNVDTHEVEIAEPFMPECRLRSSNGDNKTANYLMALAEGDIIYAHTGTSNMRILYNTKTGERREEAIVISAKDSKKITNDMVLNHCNKESMKSMNDCIFRESATFTLGDFIDQVVNGSEEIWNKVKETQLEVCRENIANADGTAGQKIYGEIKRMILGQVIRV